MSQALENAMASQAKHTLLTHHDLEGMILKLNR